MRTRQERDRERARANRIELIDAGLTRRDFARMGLLTSAGFLIAKQGLSANAISSSGEKTSTVVSPPTRPFVAPLRRLDVAQPCMESVLGPVPTESPNIDAGEWRTNP